MKKAQKVISFVLALAIIIATAISCPLSTQAATYTDEPLIYDVEYAGTCTGSDLDYYLLSLPSDGVISLTASFIGHSNSGYVNVYNLDYQTIKYFIIYSNVVAGEAARVTNSIKLSKGSYIVGVEGGEGNDLLNYTLKASYNLDSSNTVKLSSPKKGTMKVTAPKGSNVDGFEIRYKKSGDKNYTTKVIKTTKNLNTTISGLSKGKKYTVQVRKFVTDSYGYTFYSNWTKKQTVTIKK